MKCYRVKLQISHPMKKYHVFYGLAVNRNEAVLLAYARSRDYGFAVEGLISVREIGKIDFSPVFSRALCEERPTLEKIDPKLIGGLNEQ